MKHLEQAAQIQVVRWLRQYHPEILFTSPAAAGERLSLPKAMRVKAMGYTPGTPDLLILERAGLFGALFIEMKRAKGGQVSKEQREFHEKLKGRGYFVAVCHGAQEAVDAIATYMGVKTAMEKI